MGKAAVQEHSEGTTKGVRGYKFLRLRETLALLNIDKCIQINLNPRR